MLFAITLRLLTTLFFSFFFFFSFRTYVIICIRYRLRYQQERGAATHSILVSSEYAMGLVCQAHYADISCQLLVGHYIRTVDSHRCSLSGSYSKCSILINFITRISLTANSYITSRRSISPSGALSRLNCCAK